MNSDMLSGKWSQVKGQLKNAWTDLTDTDLQKTEGSLDQAVGFLQEKYGETKESVEKKLYELLSTIENKTR